jgi:hypothetical protein
LVEEISDTSSETRLQEEDNFIVEIDAPLFAEEEELMLPETEENVFVVVSKTQETVLVVDLLPHEVVDHRPQCDPFEYGGFYRPTLSEGGGLLFLLTIPLPILQTRWSHLSPLWTWNGDRAMP